MDFNKIYILLFNIYSLVQSFSIISPHPTLNSTDCEQLEENYRCQLNALRIIHQKEKEDLVSKYQEEVAILISEREDLISKLQLEVTILKSEREDLVSRHQEEVTILISEKEDLIYKHQLEVTSLRSEKEDLVSKHQEEVAILVSEREDLVSIHQEEVAILISEKEDLKFTHQAEVAILKSEKEDLVFKHQEEIAILISDNEDLVSKHQEEVAILISEKEDLISTHQVEVAILKSEKEALVSSHQEEVAILISEREDLVHNHQVKVANLESDIVSLRKELNELKDKCTSCRAPFTPVGQKCMFIEKKATNYRDATQLCKNKGAILATPSNHELFRQFQNFIRASRTNYKFYWVSATDKNHEGNWKWADGSVLNSKDQTYWGRRQPDNSGNEDCAHAKTKLQLRLNDTGCNSSTKSNPVCEYNLM